MKYGQIWFIRQPCIKYPFLTVVTTKITLVTIKEGGCTETISISFFTLRRIFFAMIPEYEVFRFKRNFPFCVAHFSFVALLCGKNHTTRIAISLVEPKMKETVQYKSIKFSHFHAIDYHSMELKWFKMSKIIFWSAVAIATTKICRFGAR